MNANESGTATPVSLAADGDSLVIAWSDGVTHRLSWERLRRRCPCATCRAKRAEPPQPRSLPVLDLAEAAPVRGKSVRPLGNYAYAIAFDDGHETGIYSLEYLRALGEEADV